MAALINDIRALDEAMLATKLARTEGCSIAAARSAARSTT
jgi:hypothetical protein